MCEKYFESFLFRCINVLNPKIRLGKRWKRIVRNSMFFICTDPPERGTCHKTFEEFYVVAINSFLSVLKSLV